MPNASTAFRFGEIHGNIPLSDSVIKKAAAFAAEHFAAEEANDFDGENVEVFTPFYWAPKIDTWWPTDKLRELGFRKAAIKEERTDVVVTLGVDQHVDAVHGPVLCYVLHNDRLTFRQGKVSHAPKTGDWFIFDDSVNHGVKEAKGASVFVGWTIPLEAV